MESTQISRLVTGLAFEPGQIVVTPGALELAYRSIEDGRNLIAECLDRHLSQDWGDLCPEDKAENVFSVQNGFRILSAYETDYGKLWVITEADRSATTVLLPEEY